MPVLSYVHQLFNAEQCHALFIRYDGKIGLSNVLSVRATTLVLGRLYYHQPGLQKRRCKEKDCKRTFNDLTGTLLDGSKRSVVHWILATFLLCLSCSSLAALPES